MAKAYKLFYLKDGKLYPPMVANPNGEATPVGVWIDAVAAPRAKDSKTGRPHVKGGGKGTHSRPIELAYRPGWHLSETPYAPQFERMIDGKKQMPPELVWALCEYSSNISYQEEAMAYGMTKNGKFRHAYAGLPFVPKNGYYRYRTNPRPDTPEWIIAGSIKVLEVLK